MTVAPRSAMVLAAGLGTRLRPVTETVPKPLIEINGRALIDLAIDHLILAGVQCVVVNIHYKAELVRAHLALRAHPRVAFSEEDELLDTGGAVAQALPLLDETFFAVNADVIWLDNTRPALFRLADAFDPAGSDAVLLLHPTATAVGYEGSGDYHLGALGKPRRRREGDVVAPYLFAGIQLLHRRLFANPPGRIFSLVRLFDRAETAGRLRAVVHDGELFHVGTPQGLAATRKRVV